MSANSKIDWTDHTWSPVLGCSKIGAGCANCYAICHARRLARNPNPKISGAYTGLTVVQNGRPNWTGKVRLLHERLDQPKSWRKPARIFVNPMSDLFHEALSFQQIHEVWCAMTGPIADHHTYQILTKRYERMAEFFEYLREHYRREYGLTGSEPHAPEILRLPQPHIWLGHSYSNQRDVEAGIGHLLRTPAAVRFASLEPLLGPVDLNYRLDWVIVGGESGAGARPMNPQWVRSLRDQCTAAGVPFFLKQWGEWVGGSADANGWFYPACGPAGGRAGSLRLIDWGHGVASDYVGKKTAGHLLDGCEWRQMPEVRK